MIDKSNSSGLCPKYFEEFQNLKDKIENKQATWKDIASLRQKYNFGVESIDKLRRGALFYDEFNRAGLIKSAQLNESFSGDIGNKPKEDLNSKNNYTKKSSLRTDGTTLIDELVELDTSELTNREKILRAHGFDPDEFELVSVRNSIWQKSCESGKKNLYASKIVIRSKAIPEKQDYFKEILDDLAKSYNNSASNKINKIEKDNNVKMVESNKMLILSYNDLHWGRYEKADTNLYSGNVVFSKIY